MQRQSIAENSRHRDGPAPQSEACVVRASTLAIAFFFVASVIGFAAPAAAQTTSSATERNIPPIDSVAAPEIAPPAAVPEEVSDEPLGQNLSAVVFLGPTDAVVAAGPGVSLDASRVPLLDNPDFTARVARFIGQPLSQRLIADIEAEVALFFRRKGLPFVAVSTPPQEITAGQLRIRVVEFRTGTISVAGNSRVTDEWVLDRITLQSGDRVASETLSQDLDWLNRSPFRRVTAQFSPGDALGATNLALQVEERKPWNIFSGYSNLGNTESGTDRYFVGATIGDVLIPGSVAAVQFTGSPDFWFDGGGPFGNVGDADYVSAALQSVTPLRPRAQLELVANGIKTNQTVGDFSIKTTTVEGTVGLRLSAYDLLSIPGDVVVGVEARGQERDRFFGELELDEAEIRIYQMFVGWNRNWRRGDTSLSSDLVARVSPGGVGNANSDTAFSNYTFGRVTNATYGYAHIDLQALRTTGQELGLFTQLKGQVSTGPLPMTEQAALDGGGAVRGYTSDDGNYDMFIVSRNEFRLPPIRTAPASGNGTLTFAPFFFSDLGFAANHGADGETAVSAGIGARGAVGTFLSANLAVAAALTDAPTTDAGDLRIDFVMTLRY